MEDKLLDLRSAKNPKARIKIMKGHFTTSHFHINNYIDISTVKVRHENSRETAKVLTDEIAHMLAVDTIVCLEETTTIGTFMAQQLANNSRHSLSNGNNISVVVPEYHPSGQILFRDNMQRMIENQQVLILAPSITTGKSVKHAFDAINYYGGKVCGICSVFSAVSKINGVEVKSIFSTKDIPDYRAYPSNECPMCKAGQKIEAIVNSYGYSKL